MANKTRLFVFFTLLSIATPSFAQQQINLTTYYPAPFGAYDRVRLVPRGVNITCNAAAVGTIFFDNAGKFQICANDGGGAPQLTPGGAWTQNGNNVFPADTATNANLRVGIGTSTPGAPLDVIGNIMTNSAYSGTNYPGRYIAINRAPGGSAPLFYGGVIDFQLEDQIPNQLSSVFRVISADVFNFGVARDLFFQLIPRTASGYGYLESWNAAGLAVGTGSGPVVFRPNRVTKMTLTSAGSLGIGTTTPAAPLEVTGATNVNGSPLAQGLLFKTTGTLGVADAIGDRGAFWVQYFDGVFHGDAVLGAPLMVLEDYDDPPRFQFQQVGPAGSEANPQWYAWIGMGKNNSNFAIMPGPSGGVGVGLSTPVNKLDVEGAAAIGAAYSGTSTAPANGLIVQSKAGIGTSNPVGYLHIYDALLGNLILFDKDNIGTPNYRGEVAYDGGSDGRFVFANYGNKVNADTTHGNTKFSWYDSVNRVYSTILTLDNNTDVGVSVDNPGAKLHIYRAPPPGVVNAAWYYGTIRFFPDLNAADGSDHLGDMVFDGATDGQFGFTNTQDNGLTTFFSHRVAGTHLMVLHNDSSFNTNNGYIEVGDLGGSGDRLRVNGNMRVTGNLNVTGTCCGPSDRRLKKDIKPIKNALEKILLLEPVTFTYIDPRYGAGTRAGLIAQDVEKIYPEWVATNDENYKTVDYLKVPIELIEAVKELKAENDILKKQLEKQQQEIEQLKNQKSF